MYSTKHSHTHIEIIYYCYNDIHFVCRSNKNSLTSRLLRAYLCVATYLTTVTTIAFSACRRENSTFAYRVHGPGRCISPFSDNNPSERSKPQTILAKLILLWYILTVRFNWRQVPMYNYQNTSPTSVVRQTCYAHNIEIIHYPVMTK